MASDVFLTSTNIAALIEHSLAACGGAVLCSVPPSGSGAPGTRGSPPSGQVTVLLTRIQGHVRVGTDTVTDPAFLVTRAMEDFVTWVDTSKIKRKVLKYNDAIDDFDLLY